MILRIINEWKDGTRQESADNYGVSTGRYKLACMTTLAKTYHPDTFKNIERGFQYVSNNPYKYKNPCTTTVTLERGWV